MSAPPISTPIAALPIPPGAQPGPGWTEQMIEMAAHVGADATLAIVDAFAGQRVYISADPARSPFAGVVSDDVMRTIAHVYGNAKFQIPTAKTALARARRAPILAAVRAGSMTMPEAVAALGTSRTYLAHLLNETEEGAGVTPAVPARRRVVDPRQIDMFGPSDS